METLPVRQESPELLHRCLHVVLPCTPIRILAIGKPLAWLCFLQLKALQGVHCCHQKRPLEAPVPRATAPGVMGTFAISNNSIDHHVCRSLSLLHAEGDAAWSQPMYLPKQQQNAFALTSEVHSRERFTNVSGSGHPDQGKCFPVVLGCETL